jgi:hypothetical protein
MLLPWSNEDEDFMGAKQVTEFRERLDRDGAVDVRISWAKAAAGSLLWVVFPLLVCVGGVLMAVDGDVTGWFVASFGVAIAAYSWIRFAETFLGRGPAVRIAEDGLTIRRWRQPTTVPWSDVVGPRRVPEAGSSEDAFVMHLSDPAYDAYIDSLPGILRRGVRRQDRNGVRLPRVFELSLSDFEALLNDDTIQSMVTCSAPYNLVLDWGTDDGGGSVLRTRARWYVNQDELPISSSMRAELAKWWDRTLPIGRAFDDDDVDWDTYDALAEDVRSDGERLARALQLELGSGSKVTY